MIGVVAAMFCHAATNGPLLVIHPEAWQSALSDFVEFKSRLGFDVTNASLEEIVGANPLTNAAIRSYLLDVRTNSYPTADDVYVLFVGDFDTIPAPEFRVLPDDSSPYYSDIYYRDLYTEFNRDGDALYGEYDTNGVGEDFDSSTFDAQFTAFTNNLIVGRMPLPSDSSPAEIAAVFDSGTEFEREVGSRKLGSLMTAGRIISEVDLGWPFGVVQIPADSWDYALKDIVAEVTNSYPDREVTTVVHVASNYTDRAGIDYAVEGDDITGDYDRGQDIVRGLWETNDNCSFLCNVSHGNGVYDFALRRNGAGFPENVKPAIYLSMSCACYDLGWAAITGGVAVASLCSSANVTLDTQTAVSGGRMVSARVQELAVLRIFCQNKTIGATFKEGFQFYVEEIQSTSMYSSDQPGVLRNMVGFQMIGDPTMIHAYPDQDADGLLDPEEAYYGTAVTNTDTDADGQTDGEEVIAATDPLNATNCFSVTISLDDAGAPVTTWLGASGRVYTVKAAAGLPDGAWSNVPGFVDTPGAGDWMSHTNTGFDAAPRFFRVNVRLSD